MLLSKSYKAFVRGIFSYDLSQDYDILYFQEGTEENLPIQKDIKRESYYMKYYTVIEEWSKQVKKFGTTY